MCCARRLVSALRFALTALRDEAIDVRLVHYKGAKGDFGRLQDEFTPKGAGRKQKKKKSTPLVQKGHFTLFPQF